MPLFRITESDISHNSVVVVVDGTIDRNSLPILQKVCEKHFKQKKKIVISLQGLVHIDFEGRKHLMTIKDKVRFDGLPEFLKLELMDSSQIRESEKRSI